MSAIRFYKYQGTGNDFILIDNRNVGFKANKSLIAKMCDRRFGIGGDGLILLENVDNYDFKMVYFNADGGEGSMCGNGGRCIVSFASFLGIFKEKTKFLAVDGEHEAFMKNNWVRLKMKDVSAIEQNTDYFFLDTGSPHYVAWVENLKDLDVFAKGREIRYNNRFAEKGTNVNFIEKTAANQIFVRTYERGVENETYSCGTGVTAAALIASLEGMKSPIKITTLGGELEIAFEQKVNGQFTNIYLGGPAEQVFEGIYAI